MYQKDNMKLQSLRAVKKLEELKKKSYFKKKGILTLPSYLIYDQCRI